MPDALLTDARLADGQIVDLEIRDGVIAAQHQPGTYSDPGLKPESLENMLVLPGLAEPHAHLDKALSAERVLNPKGDLQGAIEAWLGARENISREDIIERASRALDLALSNGALAVRTHIDVGPEIGIRGIEALLELKSQYSGLIEIQITALVSPPLAGKEGQTNRANLEAALTAGADLAGGAVALDSDPQAAIAACIEIAQEFNKGIDLHIDETLDPQVLTIRELCKQVREKKFSQAVTASHCVSLGIQDSETQKEIAKELRDSNISVVVLPQTNLYLQARDIRQAPPRGLSAIASLDEAGVDVAAGADNLQDPFNLVGRGDPLETAALMVMAGHLLPADAFQRVAGTSRKIMGLSPAGTEPGQAADLLCLKALDIREAVALAPHERRTYKAGKLVAKSQETRQIFH